MTQGPTGKPPLRNAARSRAAAAPAEPPAPSIPVGTVIRSEKAEGGLTLNLTVKPLVDTERLSFVSVLLRPDPG